MAQNAKSSAKPRLGRGLSSLIVNSAEPLPAPTPSNAAAMQPVAVTGAGPGSYVPTAPVAHAPVAKPETAGEGIQEIDVSRIVANPYQPRREFNPEDLKDLAASIAQQGILQPLMVCASAGDPAHFVLIAGERRLRAAKLAGLGKVPCIMKTATQQQMLEWALIENIQRADLNPVEKARAYRDYMDRFQLTVAQAGEKLGQPRTTVANYLRLMDLPDDVQGLLIDGSVSFGHAKVLAGLAGMPEKQIELARRVVAETLSVRQLEVLAEQAARPAAAAIERPVRTKAAYLKDLEEQLTRTLGTHVSILPGRSKHTGRMVIEYYSLDDFDRLCATMGIKVEA